MDTNRVDAYKRIGTGLALILSPLVFVIGFGIHPLEGHTAASAFQTVVDNQGEVGGGAYPAPVRCRIADPGGDRRHASPGRNAAVVRGDRCGAGRVRRGLPRIAHRGGGAGDERVRDRARRSAGGIVARCRRRSSTAKARCGPPISVSPPSSACSSSASACAERCRHPRWIGVLTIIAALVMTVGAVGSERIAAIGSVPLLIGFGYLGWETLRMPAVGPQGAQTDAGSGVRPARA